MSWWGKLLGSAFGFMVGGPLGAMLGVAIGHNFDIDFHRKLGARLKSDEREQAYDAFFIATFQVMGHVAKADGRVSENEINTAQAVMTHLHLTPTQKQRAIRLFNEGKQEDFVLDTSLFQLHNECQNRSDLVRKFMEIQLSIAYADGIPHPRERTLLLHIRDQLQFPRLLFETLDTFVRSRHRSSGGNDQQDGGQHRNAMRKTPLSEAYATLGLNRHATDDEIKKAYRRLINQHHPDKLAASGVSEETITLATEKTQKIKMAYERIKMARGM